MARETKEKAKLKVKSVQWVTDEMGTEPYAIEMPKEPGKTAAPEFNPFEFGVQEEIVNDNHQLILDAFELEIISYEEAVQRLNAADRVNRSRGKGGLHDQRKKPENRIKDYVNYRVAKGEDPATAALHALREVGQQRNLSGRWGKTEKRVGMSLDELQREVNRRKAGVSNEE